MENGRFSKCEDNRTKEMHMITKSQIASEENGFYFYSRRVQDVKKNISNNK